MQKEKVNMWKRATLVLLILIPISIGYMFYSEHKIEQEYLSQDICLKVQGVPSWADENGSIIGSGYTTFGNQSWNIVEELLIPNKIIFIYSENCGYCKKQIEYFGTTWEKYVESGLTIDCFK